MAIQYQTSHRTANMDDITTKAGATAVIRVFTGAAPAACATADSGTLLVSLPLSNPIAPGASSGVLTLSAVTSAATTSAGTAGYWRLCTSAAGTTVVAQGSCAVSGGDLNFAGGIIWTLGETIGVTSFTITATGA